MVASFAADNAMRDAEYYSQTRSSYAAGTSQSVTKFWLALAR